MSWLTGKNGKAGHQEAQAVFNPLLYPDMYSRVTGDSAAKIY